MRRSEGKAGLLDRRIGKASGRRVPVDRCEEVKRLYRTRYQGFTARHFHEHLVCDHRLVISAKPRAAGRVRLAGRGSGRDLAGTERCADREFGADCRGNPRMLR